MFVNVEMFKSFRYFLFKHYIMYHDFKVAVVCDYSNCPFFIINKLCPYPGDFKMLTKHGATIKFGDSMFSA